MSQNGVVRAQPSGASSRARKTAGVTTVSSLESRLQDLGLSHVVGPSPAPIQTRGPHSRPGSSAGRAPKPIPELFDEDCTIYGDDTQNDTYSQDVRRQGPGGAPGNYRESRGEGKPPSSQGRLNRPKSPIRLESEYDSGGGGKGIIRAVDSPDSIDSRHHDSPVTVKQGQVQAQLPPHIQPSQVIPRLPMHHYQFCPNCGYQLVENPIVNPIPQANAALPPGTVLASALPADSSDSDSDADEDDPRRPRNSAVPTAPVAAVNSVNSSGRRTASVGSTGPVTANPIQAKAMSQAELAAGKGRPPAQSAVILKEMEGRRVQRLKAPEGNVVGQGKGIRPGPKGVVLAQDQELGTGGKHRRIGSVDHNIYSSAMPSKRGPLMMMAEASANASSDADSEQDENEAVSSPSSATAAARKRGVPPLPGKPGGAQGRPPSKLAPKRPEISRLQIVTGDEDSDDSAADAKVIDIPDGDEPKGAAKGAGKSKEGGFHASMPSPGHRRISSWADGGNLKHTDFILRKPYRDVMDVYDVHDEELGVGQFGVIRSCVNRSSGLLLACKTISKERIVCIEDADDVRKEVQLMQQLRGHPNIIDLHETFEDSKHVHLVMELCKGGELFDRIKMRGQYSERNAALVFQTLVEALLYCHSNGIVHRDIKPENILLMKKDEDTVIKVIDFGVAARFRHGEVLTEFVGTPYYMAPEVLVGNYGPEADLWSAGIVLYIMLCGFPPFWGNSNDAIFDAIQNNELQFKSSKWRNVSEQAKELIRSTLAKDPKNRISALDILGHPWVVSHTQSKS